MVLNLEIRKNSSFGMELSACLGRYQFVLVSTVSINRNNAGVGSVVIVAAESLGGETAGLSLIPSEAHQDLGPAKGS